MSISSYELGPFRLNLHARVLTHAGVPVALGSRGVAVLAVLVGRAGEYVEKAFIMDAAWPGLVVEENNLASQISAIRRALARGPGGENWIETLARRGYRYVGPVVEVADEPALRASTDRERTNLPRVLNEFVGRERELAEIRQLLPGTRLLTLTGTGGIGKTRLALQAAAEVLDAYRDGVWFVDLAPLSDPELVPNRLAVILGVKESAGQTVSVALCRYLEVKEALLIIDNCEHVLNACANLSEILLRETMRVTIIATSREPLRIGAERIYALGTLPLPDPHAQALTIAHSDAVRLFVERARQSRPGFGLHGSDAHTVAKICVRLDGLPLALELAAARVAVLPVDKIVERLNDRFRLLTGGSRTALPRQQTLRATITWSFELVSEPARTLFARLSIFAGGFSLEAAEAVAVGDGLSQDDILDLLANLVDKSLVAVESNGERYSLLETIREYAREHLRAIGEEAVVRERHFDWYLRLAERAEPSLLGGPLQKQALDLLEADHDNLRAAFAWSLERPDRGDLALRMCGTLYRFFSRRGYWQEGYTWCMKALAQGPSSADGAARAKVLLTAGSIGNNVPEAESRALLQNALALSREVGDRHTEAMALNNLARVLDWDVELPQARSLLEQARSINRELGNETLELHNMSNLVNVLREQHDPEAALALAEEGLATSRSSGDRWLEAIFLYLLGRVALDRSDISAAQNFSEQALLLFRELVMPDWQSFSLVKLAYLAVVRNDPVSAQCHLIEAVDISRRFGGRLNLAECFHAMSVLASHTGHHDRAARLSGAAEVLLGSLRSSDILNRELNSYHAKCREALGDAAYEAARSEGRKLPREAAIDQAVAWLATAT